MSKPRLPWTRTCLHPLEYRAVTKDATYILRVHAGVWTAAIHRDATPVDLTKHDTYWLARDHCEAMAPEGVAS